MANGDFWLALIILLPIIGLYLLSANAVPVFFGLCLGYVLLSFDSHNANNLAQSHVHLKSSSIIVNLALLLAPALLTLALQVHSVNGRKKLFNLIPSIGVGLFCALLVVPQLPESVFVSVSRIGYWHTLIRYQATIVGLGALVSILFFWFSTQRKGEGKKHHAKAKA